MIAVGVAVVDITPPPGLALSGFGARSEPATGAHDPLTARALVVGDTALLIADVIGLDADMSARIRARSVLPAGHIVVAALHTHGGPVSMPGRLGAGADARYLARLEDGCVAALDRAAAARRPASLAIGLGADPDVARNRRHPGGPVDRALPVLRVRDADGAMMAVLTGYACHPVVLGADNRLWTADYPNVVRKALEAAHPGATALFLTGCAGDGNTGHAAGASMSLAGDAERSFAAAERIGTRVARAALAAEARALGDWARAGEARVALTFGPVDADERAARAALWRAERADAEPARRALLDIWIGWAEQPVHADPVRLDARVAALDWGGMPVVALPGEIFARTALEVRAHLGDPPAFVAGYAEDNPGYLPPAAEYPHGGYEVEEAHRYYGAPAAFAPGSAEVLADAAVTLARRVLDARDGAADRPARA